MSDVFVSYSRDDREIVARIVTALEAAGENVWVDLEDIAPSAMWMDEIKTAIAGADSMVFFLSPNSAASEVCRAELDHAVLLAKRIVPVLIRDVSDVTVPAPLPDINWHAIGSQTFDADVARLVEVLNTDIARVHQHTRLLVRATEWEGRDGDASLLLHGSQLAEAEKWLEGQTDQKPTTTPVQARFIAASRRAVTGRQRKWSIASVAIATIFAVVAGFAIVQWRTASHQRQIATHERDVAVSSQLAIEAQNALAVDPQLALLLALRAHDSAPTPASQAAVRAAVRLSTVRAILPTELTPESGAGQMSSGIVRVGMRAFDPSGQNVVVSTDHSVAVWNWSKSTADAPRAPVTFDVPTADGDVMGAEFRDENRVVFATRAGGVFEWDWTTGPSSAAVRRVAQVGRNPQLGPGATLAAAADADNPDSVVITAVTTGQTTRLVAAGLVHDVGFSPDGTLVGTNSSGGVDIWSSATGARVTSLSLGPSIDGGRLGFSPDNRRLAVGYGGTIKVVDLEKPAEVTTLSIDMPAGLGAHCCDVDEPTALVWSPDGTALAAATADSTIRVWVGGATTPVYLNGDTSASGGVSFSPDGANLLSGGARPEVWDWAAGSPISYLGENFSPPVFSPDGSAVAAADGNADASVYGALRWSKTPLTRGVPLAFSADGDHLVVDEASAVTVWDVRSHTRVGRLPAAAPDFPRSSWATVFTARFDPTGTMVAVLDTSSKPAKLLLWQWNSSAPARQLDSTLGGQYEQALLGWASDGTIRYIAGNNLESWNGHDSPRVLAVLPDDPAPLGDAEYLSATKILLSYSDKVQLWDLGEKALKDVVPGVVAHTFALSGDRAWLAVSGDDGRVLMWDLQPDDAAIEIGRYSGPIFAFNGDGSRLAIADYAGFRIVSTRFAARFPAVLDLARTLVARHLTHDEEAMYLP